MKVLFIDFSTCLKSVDDLTYRPRGGMVNSLFKITDYLAERGAVVHVLTDIEKPGFRVDGKSVWFNLKSYGPDCGPYDVLISNRGVANGYPEIDAKKRVLWTHDLPHAGFIPDKRTINAFHCTVFMSRYAEEIWRTFYPDIGKSVFIPNGVDKGFYPREKDLRKIVYFSHPNRGLSRLPFIFDCVANRVKEPITLDAYSSATMYPAEGDMKSHEYDHASDYTAATCDGFRIHSPVTDIAKRVGEAGLCIMPTGYPEICSNSVLQALASGTPIITTGNLGATQEWVRHGRNGMLTKYQPHDYMVHTVEIVRHASYVLNNPMFHAKLIRGARNTKIHTWDEIGAKWWKLLKKLS